MLIKTEARKQLDREAAELERKAAVTHLRHVESQARIKLLEAAVWLQICRLNIQMASRGAKCVAAGYTVFINFHRLRFWEDYIQANGLIVALRQDSSLALDEFRLETTLALPSSGDTNDPH